MPSQAAQWQEKTQFPSPAVLLQAFGNQRYGRVTGDFGAADHTRLAGVSLTQDSNDVFGAVLPGVIPTIFIDVKAKKEDDFDRRE